MSKILVRSNFLQFREMLRGKICYCVPSNTSLENSQSGLLPVPHSPVSRAREVLQLIFSKKDGRLPCPFFSKGEREHLSNIKGSLN